jgi:hypothetical protein
MWSIIANLIGGPIVNGLINAYKARLEAGNTTERIAADLAQRELAVQQAELEAQKEIRIAQSGRWYIPENLFAYVLAIYFAKAILFDKVIASFFGQDIFSTDPITGELLAWAGMIMIFLFGKRGIENVARILKR